MHKSELMTKRYLDENDYFYVYSGGSFGPFDFVASKETEILYVQSKCYQGPRSAEMQRLLKFKKYPKIENKIRKVIFLWKKVKKADIEEDKRRAWRKDPIVTEVR